MRISRTLMVMAALGCLLLSGAWVLGQQDQDRQINAYIDMMRKDLRSAKQTIVDQAMGLEPAEKAKFWAVYDKYQGEVKSLWDQRLANMKKYADNYEMMTDTVADELATKSMELESQRAAIRKKYYQQMKTALGARAAARFLQTEVMLDHLIDLQIGSELPLIK